MTKVCAVTVVRFGFAGLHRFARFNKFKMLGIGRLAVELKGLLAHGNAVAPAQPMAVIVEHFAKWAAINYRLIELETVALLSFERFDRNGAKLDTLDGLPRFLVPLEQAHPIEPPVLKRFHELIFTKRPADAAAPKCRILLH